MLLGDASTSDEIDHAYDTVRRAQLLRDPIRLHRAQLALADVLVTAAGADPDRVDEARTLLDNAAQTAFAAVGINPERTQLLSLDAGTVRGFVSFDEEARLAIKVDAGVAARVDIIGEEALDVTATLLDARGRAVDENDDGGEGNNARLMVPGPFEGTLVVRGYGGRGGAFRVELNPATEQDLATLRPSVPEGGSARELEQTLEASDVLGVELGPEERVIVPVRVPAGPHRLWVQSTSPIDAYLELLDAQRDTIDSNDDGGPGVDPWVMVDGPFDGFVQVHSLNGPGTVELRLFAGESNVGPWTEGGRPFDPGVRYRGVVDVPRDGLMVAFTPSEPDVSITVDTLAHGRANGSGNLPATLWLPERGQVELLVEADGPSEVSIALTAPAFVDQAALQAELVAEEPAFETAMFAPGTRVRITAEANAEAPYLVALHPLDGSPAGDQLVECDTSPCVAERTLAAGASGIVAYQSWEPSMTVSVQVEAVQGGGPPTENPRSEQRPAPLTGMPEDAPQLGPQAIATLSEGTPRTYWTLPVRAGNRVALRAHSEADTVMEVITENGDPLSSDDAHGRDPAVSWVPERDGVASIMVRAYESGETTEVAVQQLDALPVAGNAYDATPGAVVPVFLEAGALLSVKLDGPRTQVTLGDLEIECNDAICEERVLMTDDALGMVATSNGGDPVRVVLTPIDAKSLPSWPSAATSLAFEDLGLYALRVGRGTRLGLGLRSEDANPLLQVRMPDGTVVDNDGRSWVVVEPEQSGTAIVMVPADGLRGNFEAWTERAPRNANRVRKARLRRPGEPVEVEVDASAIAYSFTAQRDERHLFTVSSSIGADIELTGPGDVNVSSRGFGRDDRQRAITFVAERRGTYRLTVRPRSADGWWMEPEVATATLRWERAASTPELGPLDPAELLVEALQRKLELERATREDGLPREVYLGWRRWERRLRRAPEHPAITDFLASEEFDTLQLMPEARWLSRHDLVNPALWRNYGRGALLARGRRDARFQHIAQTEDAIVVGTSRGISVYRHGHWKWLAYDLDSGFLQGAVDGVNSRGGVADVRRVGLTDGGAVWLATADGLIRMPSINESGTRWASSAQGLTSTSVRDLVVRGERVVVGTDDGAAWFGPEGLDDSWTPFTGHRVAAVLPMGDAVLVGGEQGLWRWSREGITRLLSGRPIQNLAQDPASGDVYAITASELRQVVLDGDTARLAPVRVAYDSLADIDVNALLPMRGNEGRPALGVLTEAGLAVLQDGYLEYNDLRLVGVDAAPVLVGGSARGNDLLLLTDSGVLLHRPSRASRQSDGRVRRLLTVPEHQATYVIRHSGELQRIAHGTTRADPLSFGARDIIVDARKRVIASQGFDLVEVRADGNVVPLVEIPQKKALLQQDEGVYDLEATPDGSIWGVTDTMVFRWDGEGVQTWSGVDPKDFPCSSHYLERVLRLPDGRIWAIGSNESHIDQGTVRMIGGLCEWTGEGWVRSDVNDASDTSWFFTSTTQVDEDTVILGATGFPHRYRAGRLQHFGNLEGSGWYEMYTEHRMANLVTQGAHLGDGVWLFGSSAGVLVYHDGRWFYPDRINGLLPDDARYHRRGGRIVHAVETDPEGRIYVGTHRGLLIFDTEGEKGLAVLRTSGQLEDTLEAYELRSLEAERDAFFASLPDGHASLDVRDRWERLEREIRILKALSAEGVELKAPQATVSPSESLTRGDVVGTDKPETLLKQKEKELYDLLLELQANDPSMAQFLGARPLELQKLRERLPDNTVLIQYMPSLAGLKVHVVRRGQPSVLLDGGNLAKDFYAKDLGELSARDALFTAANELADLLEAQAEHVRGSGDVQRAANEARMNDLLRVLYVDLIDPVEDELRAADHVVFIPAGPVSYVPFGALQKPEARHRPVVTVFDHLTISVMPSLYLTDLALDDKQPRKVEGALVVGDPSNDLKHAREEARTVARVLKTKPLLGSEAVLSKVTGRAPGRRYLHFAAHGVLDDSQRGFSRSYLQLAHNERLYMNEVMAMKLQGTEAVVLSACKTARNKPGVPGSGAEYTTLARAFAHAGSDITVASLWSVPDEATRRLMERFYVHLQEEDVDAAEALTRAQRELSDDVHVAGWAGFSAFGL